MRKHAFTLIEVLIAIAIVAVLTAVMLPVFIRAKEAAKASVCFSNFRQATLSTFLYSTDYDDRYILSRYTTRVDATSVDDKTWVQLALPYTREFKVFRCPSDYTQLPESHAIFDGDVVPGDTYARYYTASKRTNIGYNYMYLSPLIEEGSVIAPMSRLQTEVSEPSNTILFGDSVYEVTADGSPQGGGSYLIVPPCRYWLDGPFLRDTLRLSQVPDEDLYTGDVGWENLPGANEIGKNMGGLWPWHSGKLTVVFNDGHAWRPTISQAAIGCDVKPAWGGYIYDKSLYLWDLD